MAHMINSFVLSGLFNLHHLRAIEYDDPDTHKALQHHYHYVWVIPAQQMLAICKATCINNHLAISNKPISSLHFGVRYGCRTPVISHRHAAQFVGQHQMIACRLLSVHYNDVIVGSIASQITSLTIVYSSVYSGTDQRKHQSSASLAFVRGIHRRPVNSPHKGPVTRKMLPFDDVIIQVIAQNFQLGLYEESTVWLESNFKHFQSEIKFRVDTHDEIPLFQN